MLHILNEVDGRTEWEKCQHVVVMEGFRVRKEHMAELWYSQDFLMWRRGKGNRCRDKDSRREGPKLLKSSLMDYS